VNARFITAIVSMSVVIAAFGAVSVEAQVARVSGVVKDVDGKPIQGVMITATTPERESYKVTKKTNKKGKFIINHTELHTYVYTFVKEGYQTVQQQVRAIPGNVDAIEVVMPPPSGQASQMQSRMSGADRAILAFNEGVEAKQAGDLELAAKRFREAADLDPTMSQPYAALAGMAHQKGDYLAAAEAAELALERNPGDVLALQVRYDAYRLAGETEKAEEAAVALRASGVSGDAAARIFNEGVEAYRAKDIDTAAVKFEQALELDPSLDQVYGVLGGIYVSKGKFDDAKRIAAQALERDPQNAQALKVLYDVARRTKDEEGANAALAALVEVDPSWVTTGLYEHAIELYNNSDNTGAAAAFEKVLEADPDHARATYLLGMSLYNSGKPGEAKPYLTRFIEIAPDDPDVAIAKEMLKYIE